MMKHLAFQGETKILGLLYLGKAGREGKSWRRWIGWMENCHVPSPTALGPGGTRWSLEDVLFQQVKDKALLHSEQ